jgi:hypothetical protein
MTTYALTYGSTIILRSDGANIPADPGNADYQAYLSWVALGNTATPAAAPAKPTNITSWAFLNRFTAAEQLAVQTACVSNMQLQVGLTQALADTTVDLTSPLVATWMAGLVAAGALSAARSAAIMVP